MGSRYEERPAVRGVEDGTRERWFFPQLRRSLGALPAYPTASALAAASMCLTDYAVTRGPQDAVSGAVLLWMAFLLGSVHGAAWQLAFAAMRRLARPLQVVCWLTLAGLFAWLIVSSLGAVARLGSRHQQLAVTALAASSVGAVGLGALLSLMQPTRAHPAGAVFRYRLLARCFMAASTLATSIALFIADHRILVGLYPSAHQALRFAAVLAGMFALCLVPELLRLPRLGRAGAAALAVISLGVVALPATNRGGQLLALTTHPWSADALRLSHLLFDADRDGYSALLGGGDCDDLSPRVHPGAREISDNGIDDNCALGDRSTKPTPVEKIAAPHGESPVDVVLLTIDTLRPDHLGIYNRKFGPKGRATSPNIDAWAKSGTYVYRNAFTTGGWTVIALASMMRGLYPRRLNWTSAYETSRFRIVPDSQTADLRRGEQLLQFFAFPAQDTHITLAELLRRRHMRTIAVVDDGYSEMLQPGTGLSGGFDEYVHMPNTQGLADQLTVDTVLARLAQPAGKQRIFLWVHVFGPHSPNQVIPNVRQFGPSIADGYDHEVLYMDSQVGRLLSALSARRPEPLVIVAGDHGEVIREDNRFHGYSLDEALMRIPLIVRVPGARGAAIDAPVSLVDVFATVLGATRTPGPSHLDSVDLAPLMDGAPAPAPARAVITDCWRYLADRRRVLDATAVTDGTRFVFYDYLTGTRYWTKSRNEKPHWLSNAAAETDSLARVLLAYSEEGNALPQ